MTAVAIQMLAGLGIFLFGMASLEAGIEALSSKRVTAHMQRLTGNPIGSVSFGAAVTAILQSSSMVALLVLAFASAGVLPLYNAIGIVIGSNLGTTFKGWIVATIGFKVDITSLALPLLGAGGLAQVLSARDQSLRYWGKAVVGLGLLLLGLSVMKDSVAVLPEQLDISLLQGYHPVVYLLVGTALTAIIQSSSATVMLTLAALDGGIVNLAEAGALVIGADLGTTSTTVIGSLTGAYIKRQLAVAQLVFNAVVDLGAFLLLLPFLPAAAAWLGLDDPLYAVVAFHSTVNLLGLLAFLPFLRRFSHWVSGFFVSAENPLLHLAEIKQPVPEAGLPALVDALRQLWLVAVLNILHNFRVGAADLDCNEDIRDSIADTAQRIADIDDVAEVYEQLREQESAIFQLSYKLQQAPLEEQQSEQLATVQELARNIVYASKTMKDVSNDIAGLDQARHRGHHAADWLFKTQRDFQRGVGSEMMLLVQRPHDPVYREERLEELRGINDQHYRDMDAAVYSHAGGRKDMEPELSIQLNVNREIHHANRNLLNALRLFGHLPSPAAPGPGEGETSGNGAEQLEENSTGNHHG